MTAVQTPPRTARRWRPTTVVGLLLVAIGLGLLGYVGWQYVGTNVVARHKQAQLRQDLTAQWRAEGPSGTAAKDPGKPGTAMALMRVPRFGSSYQVPVVRGVDDTSLASGIGWFPDTARPGQVGNFAVAGHRVTHGEPFRSFLSLRKGDKVVVETRTHVYTYVLRDDGSDRVLDFAETWILDPVPGRPTARPTKAILTMVTCSELFHTDDRNAVFGDLVSTVRKVDRVAP